jgi:hypothetical protein
MTIPPGRYVSAHDAAASQQEPALSKSRIHMALSTYFTCNHRLNPLMVKALSIQDQHHAPRILLWFLLVYPARLRVARIVLVRD